jgi:hypothetical protein
MAFYRWRIHRLGRERGTEAHAQQVNRYFGDVLSERAKILSA